MVNLDPKVCPKCGQQFEGDFCPFCGEPANPLSAMDDIEAQFGDFNQEMAKVEEEAELSEDLDAYAKGFPDWDLLPTKK